MAQFFNLPFYSFPLDSYFNYTSDERSFFNEQKMQVDSNIVISSSKNELKNQLVQYSNIKSQEALDKANEIVESLKNNLWLNEVTYVNINLFYYITEHENVVLNYRKFIGEITESQRLVQVAQNEAKSNIISTNRQIMDGGSYPYRLGGQKWEEARSLFQEAYFSYEEGQKAFNNAVRDTLFDAYFMARDEYYTNLTLDRNSYISERDAAIENKDFLLSARLASRNQLSSQMDDLNVEKADPSTTPERVTEIDSLLVDLQSQIDAIVSEEDNINTEFNLVSDLYQKLFDLMDVKVSSFQNEIINKYENHLINTYSSDGRWNRYISLLEKAKYPTSIYPQFGTLFDDLVNLLDQRQSIENDYEIYSNQVNQGWFGLVNQMTFLKKSYKTQEMAIDKLADITSIIAPLQLEVDDLDSQISALVASLADLTEGTPEYQTAVGFINGLSAQKTNKMLKLTFLNSKFSELDGDWSKTAGDVAQSQFDSLYSDIQNNLQGYVNQMFDLDVQIIQKLKKYADLVSASGNSSLSLSWPSFSNYAENLASMIDYTYVTPKILLLNYDMGDTNCYTGGSSITDLTSYGNNGTLSGDFTYEKVNGGIIDFGGTNATLAINNNGTITPSEISLEVWIKPSIVSGNYEIFRMESGGSPVYLFSFQESNIISFGLFTSVSGYNELDVTLDPTNVVEKWCHFVATYESGSKKLYLNGQLIGEASDEGIIKYEGSSLAHIASSSGVIEFLNGKIGLFKMYNYALTSTEVNDKYSEKVSRFTDVSELVLSYDMGNTNCYNGGSSLNDLSNYNNDGTLSGDFNFMTDYDGVVDFGGSNAMVSINNNGTITPPKITLEAWVRPDSISNYHEIIRLEAGTPVYVMRLETPNNILFGITTTDTGYSQITVNLEESLIGKWCHIVATYESGFRKIYLNGQLINESNDQHGDLHYDSNNTCYISSYVGSSGFVDGKIGLVNIYNYVLTSSEVTNRYNVNVDRFSEPFSGYALILPFDGDFNDTSNGLVPTVVGSPIITASASAKLGSGSMLIQNSGNGLYFTATKKFNFKKSDFTIETWVKFTSSDTSQAIFTDYSTWSSGCIFFGRHDMVGGRVCLMSSNLGVPLLQDPQSVEVNVWVHYAIVRSGNTFTLYKNGSPVSTANNSGSISSVPRNVFYVGYAGDNPSGYGFTGYLDSFKVNNGTALYTGEFTPEGYIPPTGNYKLDGVQSTTLLKNGASYDELTDTYTLDGVNDYAETNYIIPAGDFSFGAWAKSTTVGSWSNRLMGSSDSLNGTSGVDIIWQSTGSGKLYIVARGNSNYDIQSSNISDLSGLWHHVVVTYNSSNSLLILYVDGQEVARNSSTGMVISSNLPFRIGRTGNGTDAFYGTVSDVFIDTNEISAADVLNKFNTNKEKYGYGSVKVNGSEYGALLKNGALYNDVTNIYTVDGSNDYAILSNAPKGTSQMSISAWVKADTLGGWKKAVIFPYGENSWSSPFSSYQLGFFNNKLMISFNVNSDYNVGYVQYDTNAIADNWYHVAGTFNNGVIKMYVNGQLVQTKNVSSTGTSIIYTNRSKLIIGLDAEYFQSEQFQGQVGDIELSTTVLSDADVLNLYNSNRTYKYGYHGSIVSTELAFSYDLSNTDSYDGTGKTVYDLTTKANNAKFVNTPSFSTNNNGVITLNGSNYATINDDPSLEFGNGEFSTEMWVKFSRLKGYQGILSKPGFSDGNGFILLLEANNTFMVYAGSGGWQVGVGGQMTPVANTWYHVVVTRNSSGVWKMYINGEDKSGNPGVNTLFTFPDNITPMYLGTYTNFPGSNNTPAGNLEGSIGLVNVWKGKSFTQAEVVNLYNSNIDRFGLVLDLDAGNSNSYSGSGNVWTDLTKNNNNGILTNGATFNSANGGSIVFDGNDDYVVVSDSDTISITGDMTINCWLKVTDFNGYRGIVSKVNVNIPNPFDFYLQSGNGKPSFMVGNGSNGYYFNGSVAPQAGVWQNITITLQGEVVKYYLNGTLIDTSTLTGGTSIRTDNGGPLYIGRRPDGVTKMLGNIAILRIYSRSLSSTEVSQNYSTLSSRFA